MTAYVVGRVLYALATLLILLAAVFFLTQLTGDPVMLMLPLEASLEQQETLRHALGLDAPIHVRFARFMAGAIRGDFGDSLTYGLPALSLVLERLPATLLLAVTTMVVTIATAVPIGIAAARHPRGLVDRLVSVVSFGGLSVPGFWLALMLILLFAVGLRWLPTSGYGGWQYLILPVVALVPAGVGRIAQVLRSSMVDEFAKAYTTTARAMGLGPNRIALRHVLPNATIPAFTVAGIEAAHLVGGAIIVEIVFAWPGVGYLVFQAIQARDLPLIEATVFVVSALVLLVNLAVDLAYPYIDPRIRVR